jgi:hypothetical protein
MTDRRTSELNELIKKAQAEPGIVDLLAVYGQYGEVMEKSRKYLIGMEPKIIVSTTSGTS